MNTPNFNLVTQNMFSMTSYAQCSLCASFVLNTNSMHIIKCSRAARGDFSSLTSTRYIFSFKSDRIHMTPSRRTFQKGGQVVRKLLKIARSSEKWTRSSAVIARAMCDDVQFCMNVVISKQIFTFNDIITSC